MPSHHYRPQTKFRGSNVFTPVCQSSCSQVCGQTPPWTDTPWQTARPPPRRRPLKRAVRILLECILVSTAFHLILGVMVPLSSSTHPHHHFFSSDVSLILYSFSVTFLVSHFLMIYYNTLFCSRLSLLFCNSMALASF